MLKVVSLGILFAISSSASIVLGPNPTCIFRPAPSKTLLDQSSTYNPSNTNPSIQSIIPNAFQSGLTN